MSAFPIFRNLSTSRYGLYPGTSRKPDLQIQLEPGLTMVLGANGLGKTTLVNILFRMCTGPYDIPGSRNEGRLGGVKRSSQKMQRKSRALFAERVNDGAELATATLTFTLAETEIAVSRSLSDLELTDLHRDGESLPVSEELFQRVIEDAAGVESFGDWILLLRHVVFYFEDRRALVWDPSAQRQILRILFLPTDASKAWTDAERDILQQDSRARNLQNVLGKEEAALSHSEDGLGDTSKIRREISKLEKLQMAEEPQLEELNEQVLELTAGQRNARLAVLHAEGDRESAFRDLEHRQLSVIASAFPSSDDTTRYLLARLVSNGVCLSCGAAAPDLDREFRERAKEGHCIMCNEPLHQASVRRPTAKSIAKAEQTVVEADERVSVTKRRSADADAEFEATLKKSAELESSVAQRRVQIAKLASKLPPEDVELHKQRSDLASMRARLEVQKRDLATRRDSFAEMIDATTRRILLRKDEVQDSFFAFASGFLLEQCELVWMPDRDTVGESGRSIEFPAFELEMAGADFLSPVRREGPGQVSESQREFIDLAFRMALISVAGFEGSGSVVIDAPESSLDAVFVRRAAKVLSQFAAGADNRLLITSNLVEGDLIPALLREAGVHSPRSRRVVDLLKIAAPTAATKRLMREYERVRSTIFHRVDG